MILIILDWIGTVFVVFGSFLITLKKARKPKIRLFALSSYLISNIFWIPFAIMLRTYGLLITQIFLFIINLRGIINCYKESKMEKKLKRNKEK